MSKNTAIAECAFRLLALGKNEGTPGLTMSLASGSKEWVKPMRDPCGMGSLLAAAGVRPRAGAYRSLYDLNILVESGSGDIDVRIERITGMASLRTIPDPTVTVARFKAPDGDAASAALQDALEKHFPGISFTLRHLMYRQKDFVCNALSPSRTGTAPGFWAGLCGAANFDHELANLVAGAVEKALNWGSPDDYPAERIELWIKAGDTFDEAYVTITPRDGGFGVHIDDHICWPWCDNVLNQTVQTAAELKSVVSRYIAETYGFEKHLVSVFFRYSLRV